MHETQDEGLEDPVALNHLEVWLLTFLPYQHLCRGFQRGSHAVAIYQEDPLIHLEVIHVQGRHELHHLDGLHHQTHVGLSMLSENGFQLIQQVRPQLPQGISKGVRVEAQQQYPGQQE